ncbi:MAG: hypothetical protein ACOYM9_00520 [Bradymonadia bacterium]|jgi:hypothetical protein
MHYFVFAIVVLFLACGEVENESPDAENSSIGTAESAVISQSSYTKGKVRSIITTRLKNYAPSISVCFNSYTTAQIISASTAISLLNASDYDDSTDSDIVHYLDQLASNSSAKAVKVTQVVGSTTYKYVVIPDTAVAGENTILLDISDTPGSGETCVACTDNIGKVSPCTCSMRTKLVCGASPVVSCTSECTFCPSSPTENLPGDAGSICGTSTPFTDTGSFTGMSVGSYL